MVARITTVAFQGIEAMPVDVQVQMTPGKPAFNIVGLPDKAVAEAASGCAPRCIASGLALPAKRIIVNLAPADLPEGRQPLRPADRARADGGDGRGPADAHRRASPRSASCARRPHRAGRRRAARRDRRQCARRGLICPAACGPEAAWASDDDRDLARAVLIALANHFRGTQVLTRPAAGDPPSARRARPT